MFIEYDLCSGHHARFWQYRGEWDKSYLGVASTEVVTPRTHKDKGKFWRTDCHTRLQRKLSQHLTNNSLRVKAHVLTVAPWPACLISFTFLMPFFPTLSLPYSAPTSQSSSVPWTSQWQWLFLLARMVFQKAAGLTFLPSQPLPSLILQPTPPTSSSLALLSLLFKLHFLCFYP